VAASPPATGTSGMARWRENRLAARPSSPWHPAFCPGAPPPPPPPHPALLLFLRFSSWSSRSWVWTYAHGRTRALSFEIQNSFMTDVETKNDCPRLSGQLAHRKIDVGVGTLFVIQTPRQNPPKKVRETKYRKCATSWLGSLVYLQWKRHANTLAGGSSRNSSATV
jgi:hypothetical protein